MLHILVVEDDLDLNGLFCRTLQRSGYIVHSASCAAEALSLLDAEHINLMISDVMMAGMDGFELVQSLRASGFNLPILLITAKGDIADKQTGFLSGADDYMVKPINLQEMLLRVQALLRRAKSVSDQKLQYGGTTLEYGTWTLRDKNGSQVLPPKEFQILYKLLSYPGQIFTRQQILDDVWGMEDYVDSHTLDVHMSRLRERLKGNEDFEISTIRGLGYRVVKL